MQWSKPRKSRNACMLVLQKKLLYYATPFCMDNLIIYIFDWNKWFLHMKKTAGNKHKVEYIMVLQWHYLKYKSLPCKSIAIRISFLKRWDGNIFSIVFESIIGLLIYTLISENQVLEKSRSVSNPRKILGWADIRFFQVSTLTKS